MCARARAVHSTNRVAVTWTHIIAVATNSIRVVLLNDRLDPGFRGCAARLVLTCANQSATQNLKVTPDLVSRFTLMHFMTPCRCRGGFTTHTVRAGQYSRWAALVQRGDMGCGGTMSGTSPGMSSQGMNEMLLPPQHCCRCMQHEAETDEMNDCRHE